MNSIDIAIYIQSQGMTLSNYIDFNNNNQQNIISNFPKVRGLYIMRLKPFNGSLSEFGRLIGVSDILYIGKTANNNTGLRARVGAYFNPNPTQPTNSRINKIMISNRHSIEIAYIENNEPRNLETYLLNKYVFAHDELPPFNRSN